MHESERTAVLSVAPEMMRSTAQDGFEHCALVYRTRKGFRVTKAMRGLHNNVIPQAVWFAIVSLFTREAALIHTHPHCRCHNGEEFSGHRDARGRIASLGDVCVPCLGRIRRIWLIAPSGLISSWDGRGEIRIVDRIAPPENRTRFMSRFNGMWPKPPQL